jgi:hypothetical protein
MVMDAATIAQMEKDLEEARDQLLREDGRRYQIIMRRFPRRAHSWQPHGQA